MESSPTHPPLLPPRWLRNPHANTIYSYLRPRGVHLPVPMVTWLPVDQGVELLLCSHWQPQPAPALILVHGLEGSSDAGYMQTTTALARHQGWHVINMNVRSCGASESRCETLYNSGMSADVAQVVAWTLRQPQVLAAALGGFSMGGNLVLKYASECGAQPPLGLEAVVAVSPCLDLAACAAALHRRSNFLYERRFLLALKARLRRQAGRHPGRYPVERLAEVHSVHDFDDIITAPATGYRDADDYYARASAANGLAAIRVPTLILHAEDDPFIVITPASRAKIRANPAIEFVTTPYGGHCAFINQRHTGEGVYWGEARLVDFAVRSLRASAAHASSVE